MMTVYAMHVAEGILPIEWCIFWAIVCVPFLYFGYLNIKKNSDKLLLLALCGAYCFALSALKVPSFTGSSSHLTGVGLGAILFGPMSMTILGMLVLLFQALLLAHGGLTTLGANIFSMAVVGPVTSYFLYFWLNKAGVSRKIAIFVGVFLGNLSTYLTTSIQLALGHSQGDFWGSLAYFIGVFALTQLPLAVVEGLITIVVLNTIAKTNLGEITT